MRQYGAQVHTLNQRERRLGAVLPRILQAKQSWKEWEHGEQRLCERLWEDWEGPGTRMHVHVYVHYRDNRDVYPLCI